MMPQLFVSDLRAGLVAKACADLDAFPFTESVDKPIIYSPCAMGQVVNATNVDTMAYPIICGSANNQLLDDSYAEILQKNGVLYCPDFLANAGGVIAGAGDIEGWTTDMIIERCEGLGELLLNVFTIAKSKNITPLEAAIMLAIAEIINRITFHAMVSNQVCNTVARFPFAQHAED